MVLIFLATARPRDLNFKCNLILEFWEEIEENPFYAEIVTKSIAQDY